MSRMECPPPEAEVRGAWAWQVHPGFASSEPPQLLTGAAPNKKTNVEVVPLLVSYGSELLPERDFRRGFLPLISRGVFANVPRNCHQSVKYQFVGEI